jgi:hypothetical protein
VAEGLASDAYASLVAAGAAEGPANARVLALASHGGRALGRQWTEATLELPVPPDAETLALTFSFAGDGEAWMGPVSLEVIEP